MSGTAHSRKTTAHPGSFVLGGSHKLDAKGNMVPMTEHDKEQVAATCSRIGGDVCETLAKGALGILAALAATWLLTRQHGGTRKAKKSNRKARATRSRKH